MRTTTTFKVTIQHKDNEEISTQNVQNAFERDNHFDELDVDVDRIRSKIMDEDMKLIKKTDIHKLYRNSKQIMVIYKDMSYDVAKMIGDD